MLQMPSSILSLVSFSKGLVGLFGGVCIGIQVALNIVVSGLSNPKTSVLIATRTAGNVPSPSKCVPSSGSFPFPFAYVAALAFATFVFAALFCIIRAKRVCSPVSSQPDPSPPSDMGSSCGAENDPPPTRWWWIIGLIVAILGLAFVGFYVYFAYDDAYFAYDNLHSNVGSTVHAVASFFGQNMQLWEVLSDTFHPIISFISALMTDFFLHGRGYCWIFMLSAMGYFGSLLAIRQFCTLRALVATKAQSSRISTRICIFMWVGTTVIIGASPFLSWMHWIPYYSCGRLRYHSCLPWICVQLERLLTCGWMSFFKSRGGLLLDQLSAVVGWDVLSLTEKSLVIGPSVVHATVYVMSWFFCAVSATVKTLRAVSAALSQQPSLLLRVILDFRSNFVSFYGPVLHISLMHCYVSHHPYFPHTLWEQPWKDFPQGAYKILVDDYRKWKFDQIAGFSEIVSGLRTSFKLCVKTWHALTCMQKMLIVIPAALYYSHFYIVSHPLRCARRPLIFPAATEGTQDRQYGSQVVSTSMISFSLFLSYLQDLVENRSAVSMDDGKSTTTSPRGVCSSSHDRGSHQQVTEGHARSCRCGHDDRLGRLTFLAIDQPSHLRHPLLSF
ncbi:hypothetical protein C8R43DRAFT_1119884 [Mycena crocata]|nr:hypothetical protein C8R43DRAFT_1119884 [Mycena crocata]